MYREWIDTILQYFNEHHADDLAAARKEFFDTTGEIFDDDAFYEERTTNYLEWFLFDRPFRESRSAIAHYLALHADRLQGDDLETIRALAEPIHSLFEVRRLIPKKSKVVLTDLADGTRYDVTERRSLIAMDKGDIFEARLLTRGDKTLFMSAFVHHPRQARRFLLKSMKARRKAGVEDTPAYLMILQRLWMQCQRYAHVDPQRIYCNDRIQELSSDSGPVHLS